MKSLKVIFPCLALVTAITVQAQQDYNPSKVQRRGTGEKSHDTIVRITERTTKAIDYSKRSGVTNLGIRSTSLSPTARGSAKMERKPRGVEIDAEFDGLPVASRFGPEYLTYILWAITPEGCAANLGEVPPNDLMKAKLNVTTEFQIFGLIVTAEPYFAVSQPSDVVVMDSVFRNDSVGHEQVDARYQLLRRGSYTSNVSPSQVKPIVVERGTPLHLYEARNAFWIALWAGAEKNAAELFAKAERALHRAEAFHASRAEAQTVLIAARETVEIAESARVAALKRQSNLRISSNEGVRTGFGN